jgi:hypothetical protein
MVPKMMRIRGPLKPGLKIPKMNAHGALRGDLRFFNAKGEPFEADVPNDPYYQRMIAGGDVELAPDPKAGKKVTP